MCAEESSWTKPAALHIGQTKIFPPIVLAPMSSLTTLPMRTLCEEQGCGLTITEFLAAPALAAKTEKMMSKITPSLNGRPFGVQIFGRDIEQMKQAAQIAVVKGAAIVDINMGCPSKKITKSSSGVALMREPEAAKALVRAVVEGVDGKAAVTVKMRTGWDEKNRIAPEFARQMVEAGAKAITVHGRTRQQGFSGAVDLETIARVKQEVDTVPVIANGDIVDLESLVRMLKTTGCDGVAIGRAALGNPWIFAQFRSWWLDEPISAPPTPRDRIQMYLRHLQFYLGIAEEQRAVLEMRKFAGWYLKGMHGAANLRKKINTLTDVASISSLLDSVW
ncbi:MAG: tRNA dihydrouridine synthase DusB [Pseudomonadota bacterium]